MKLLILISLIFLSCNDAPISQDDALKCQSTVIGLVKTSSELLRALKVMKRQAREYKRELVECGYLEPEKPCSGWGGCN